MWKICAKIRHDSGHINFKKPAFLFFWKKKKHVFHRKFSRTSSINSRTKHIQKDDIPKNLHNSHICDVTIKYKKKPFDLALPSSFFLRKDKKIFCSYYLRIQITKEYHYFFRYAYVLPYTLYKLNKQQKFFHFFLFASFFFYFYFLTAVCCKIRIPQHRRIYVRISFMWERKLHLNEKDIHSLMYKVKYTRDRDVQCKSSYNMIL